MSETKTPAQLKREALERAHMAVNRAQHGTEAQKEAAAEELKRAEAMSVDEPAEHTGGVPDDSLPTTSDEIQ